MLSVRELLMSQDGGAKVGEVASTFKQGSNGKQYLNSQIAAKQNMNIAKVGKDHVIGIS